jgi:zinc transport system permease protein
MEYFATLTTVLEQPFMQRAIFVGLVMAVASAILGVFLTLRRESFTAEAVAHGSLAGIALGLLLGWNPLALALLTAIAMGVLLTYLRRRSQIAADSAIGLVFTFMFSIGVLLLNLQSGYRPELSSYLFGNILAVSVADILLATVLAVVVFIWIRFSYRSMLYLTLDEELAHLKGIKVALHDYFFTIIVACAVVIAVKVVGIILATALFVIPAVNAKLLARKFADTLPIALAHNLLAMLVGLLLALYWPPGPVITIVSTSILLLCYLGKKLRLD